MQCYTACIVFILVSINVVTAQAELSENLTQKFTEIENRTSAKHTGTVQINHLRIGLRSYTLFDTECRREYSCLNCTTARVCAPQPDDRFVEVARAPCPLDRPLCDPSTGSCVAHDIAECVSPSEPKCFKKDGLFPHPTDCTKFVYCSNYNSFLFQCANNKNYDHKLEQCSTSACNSINCDNQDGRKVPYPFSNKYFSYCTGGSPAGVDRCDGTDQLNVTSQVCEPPCDLQSFIMDPKDCTKYYRCDYEWVDGQRNMVKIHDTCPAGHVFSDVVFQCLPGVPGSDCFNN